MVYRTFRWFELVGTLLGCCLLLFIIAPLVGMVLATDQEQLGSAVRDSEVVASIKLTLRAAFLATAVSAVAGVPLAYFLARKRFRGRAILLAIVDLPEPFTPIIPRVSPLLRLKDTPSTAKNSPCLAICVLDLTPKKSFTISLEPYSITCFILLQNFLLILLTFTTVSLFII